MKGEDVEKWKNEKKKGKEETGEKWRKLRERGKKRKSEEKKKRRNEEKEENERRKERNDENEETMREQRMKEIRGKIEEKKGEDSLDVVHCEPPLIHRQIISLSRPRISRHETNY